jgi:ferritin-like metal-binding protein YciE
MISHRVFLLRRRLRHSSRHPAFRPPDFFLIAPPEGRVGRHWRSAAKTSLLMTLQSLTDLLLEELQDLYDAEQQLAKALPKMAEAAFSEELREAFELHTEQTEEHIARLEQVFKKLKQPAQARHCPAMEGLIEEGSELLEQEGEADPTALDAALIASAQKIEHYEIASYGSARTFAQTLGAKEVAKLLQLTLDEEAETDRILTSLAISTINLDAAESDSEIQAEAQESQKTSRK